MSTVVRHSFTNAVATAALLAAGAVSTVLVAHLLGPHSLGVVTYAMWVVGLAVIAADLGVPSALARFLPGLRREGAAVADGVALALARAFGGAIALIVLVVLAVAAWLAATGRAPVRGIDPEDYLGNPLFWGLVALAVGGQGAVVYALGLLRGRQDFATLARLMTASAGVQVAATACGAYAFGIAGAIAGTALLGLLPAAFVLRSLRRGEPPPRPLRRRLVRYCGTYWASYLLQAVTNTRTEVFFLARAWGTEAVALFSVGLTLANIAVQAPILLTGSLLPHIAQHMAAGEHAQAAELYRSSLRVMALMAFPACLGLAAVAPAFVPLLYGRSFDGAVLPAAILVGASALGALTSVAQTYMNAAERNGFTIAVGLAGAAAVVGSGLLLVPLYGVLAAAVVRGVVQVATAAASLRYVRRHLGAPAELGVIARILCAALACAAAAHAVVLAIPGPGSLAAAIPAGVVAYGLALKLFRCVGAGDVARLKAWSPVLPGPLSHAMSGAARFYA